MLICSVLLALLIGWAGGGRLSRWEDAGLRLLPLPVLALLLQRGLGLLPSGAYDAWAPVILLLSYGSLLAFCLGNRRTPKTALLTGLGSLCNLAVIATNGFRMPVSPLIYDYPKYASLVERIRSGALPEYVLVDWDGPLWFLGDAIPIFGGLASVGDLLMGAGLVLLIVHLMRAKAAEAVPVDENGSERTE